MNEVIFWGFFLALAVIAGVGFFWNLHQVRGKSLEERAQDDATPQSFLAVPETNEEFVDLDQDTIGPIGPNNVTYDFLMLTMRYEACTLYPDQTMGRWVLKMRDDSSPTGERVWYGLTQREVIDAAYQDLQIDR